MLYEFAHQNPMILGEMNNEHDVDWEEKQARKKTKSVDSNVSSFLTADAKATRLWVILHAEQKRGQS